MFPQPRRLLRSTGNARIQGRPQTVTGRFPTNRLRTGINSPTQRTNIPNHFPPQQRVPSKLRQSQIGYARREPTRMNTNRLPPRNLARFQAQAPVVKIKRPGFFDGFFSIGINPPKQVQQRRRTGFTGNIIKWQRRSAMIDLLRKR